MCHPWKVLLISKDNPKVMKLSWVLLIMTEKSLKIAKMEKLNQLLLLALRNLKLKCERI